MTSKQCLECGRVFKEPKAGPVLFFCSDECANKHSNIKAAERRTNALIYHNAITTEIGQDYLLKLTGVRQ